MDVISIILALGAMCISILVPGVFLSIALIKKCTFMERGVFSFIFGTFSIFIVYVLVKDNIMLFGWGPIVVSYMIMLGSVLFNKDAREYISSIGRNQQ